MLCPPPGDLPDPEVEPMSLMSPALAGGFFATNATWEALSVVYNKHNAVAKSLQSCPALYDPMDCSLPGSSVHGIPQARILEWVAIPFSR